MKNLKLFSILIALFIISAPAFADNKQPQKLNIQITGDSISQDDINLLKSTLNDYQSFNSSKKLKDLKYLYAPEYINADGLDKDEAFKIIEKTWKTYPNMTFDTIFTSIKISGDYASVETEDAISASNIQDSSLKDNSGILYSHSNTIIYLKKYAKSWKIYSDKVLAEKTIIKYGSAKNCKFEFNAPNQVFAGQNYTATLKAFTNTNVLTIASISKQPIVYPEANAEDIFRQVPVQSNTLERIMKANSTNNNELAVASVGITELIPDIYQKPQPKLTGMAVLIQRVNIIPKSIFVNETPKPLNKISKDDNEK